MEGLRCAFASEHRFRSMAFPSVKLTTLASLAHRLPAACWLAQRLEQAPERWVTLPVWWVEGDLDMVALDLVTTLSSDGQWLPPLPSTALDGRAPSGWGALLWVDGHLRLQGALTGGWHTPASAAEPSSPAVHALVMGDAQVHCACCAKPSYMWKATCRYTHCCGAMARPAALRCWANPLRRWDCSRAGMHRSGTNRPALTSRCKMQTQRAIRRFGSLRTMKRWPGGPPPVPGCRQRRNR